MTNQDKIKEAYGEDYEKIKYYIDADGWLDGRPCDPYLTNVYNRIFDDCDRKFDSIRPKSLQGIENNNGWIKIESEDDLPKKNVECWVKFSSEIIHAYFEFADTRFSQNGRDFYRGLPSHYQPIEKPKPPIY